METVKSQFWIDKLAEELIAREERLNRGVKVFRTESGLGASGFPHIGSFGDATRNNSVALALKDQGVKSEFIAYSDDRDGLRKVPLSLPDWLEKHIGSPVTDIPDPFGDCHQSYGEHMCSLLVESLDKAGIKYSYHSGTEDYMDGVLNEQIEKILLNAEKVGKLIKEVTGQDKFITSLPYFPVCEECGKLYTTRAYGVLPKEHKVMYVCDQEFIGKNLNNGKRIVIKGCGNKGEAKYFNGTGKLNWKVEFSARWAALGIIFEAHGKDILDSVKTADEVSRQVLNWEPPLHVVYEMFLDKSGKKISKSYGNVFTPQVWFRYGSTQSLILLMLKRFIGTRTLDVTDVPKYMDEINKLEGINFGVEEVANEKELKNLKRLFKYIYLMKPPKKPVILLPYSSWVELAKILPEKNQLEFAIEKLRSMGYLDKITPKVKEKVNENLGFAINWNKDFLGKEPTEFSIDSNERLALRILIDEIGKSDDSEHMQKVIFDVAKKNNIKPARFFQMLYQILLKADRGPKLGQYIFEVGKEEIIRKLREAL